MLPEVYAGNQALALLPPASFVLLSWQQPHGTALPEPNVENLGPELPVPIGFVLLHWPQLQWLLEAHASIKVDPRASAVLWDNSIQAHWVCVP
jgi:hypothetical protein